jgi:heme A synthase
VSVPVALTAFHILGACFAIWAVVLATLGFTRPEFPRDRAGQRAVMVISLTLMIGAIASAIIVAANEDEKEKGHESAPAHENKPPPP